MTVKLEEIGFYTLSEARVLQAGVDSPLWRCELVLTARCNFRCPYCRSVGGKDLDYGQAASTVRLWARQGLKNIRFSGGEPTLYPSLIDLVTLAKQVGVERIALSTNGSASIELYRQLYDAGVNDFSISLDACCAEDGDKMAGGIKGAWKTVVENIIFSKMYVPDDFYDWTDEGRYEVLRHEKMHVRQFHLWPIPVRWLWPLNHLLMALCYLLFPLPVLWTMRAKFEREGYTQTLLALHERGEMVGYEPNLAHWLATTFSDGSYLYMWNYAAAHRWAAKTMADISSGKVKAATEDLC